MRNTSFGLPQEGDASFHPEDHAPYPTASAALGEIGRVIAVCLGLGVLAHLVVAIIGAH